ncbi:uncharacterized protein LOC134842119 [Symsagittifera roscoffensis]|uniref:uncharacterized protein LOC134842119 n=1 Tax=Symsagittifera roscoffensis TaxID=84072 RepID=UPI00307BB5A5
MDRSEADFLRQLLRGTEGGSVDTLEGSTTIAASGNIAGSLFPEDDFVDTYLTDYDPFRPEIVVTEKGARALCYGGYVYSLNKASAHSIYWVCREHGMGCRGKVRSSLSMDLLRDVNHHNHAPSPAEVRQVKAKAAIKSKASEAYKPKEKSSSKSKPANAHSNEVTGAELVNMKLEPSGSGAASGFLDDGLLFLDTAAEELPMEPSVLEEVNIDGIWSMTKEATPKRFLLYDNRSSGQSRLLVFATDEQLGYLASQTRLYMDISPSLAPSLFKYLVILMTDLGEEMIPLVYAFAAGDSPDIFEEIFTVILSKCQDLSLRLNPIKFILGYNVNCVDAVKRLFGNDFAHEGKFYHLSQFVWHSIQTLELTGLCQQSETFRLICCELVALAFLPPDQVWEGMGFIKQTAIRELENGAMREETRGQDGHAYSEKVKELLDMFDTLFVTGRVSGKQKPNGDLEVYQMPPMFPVEAWNLFSRTLNEDPTGRNNILDTCGSHLSYVNSVTKPHVFKALSLIRQEQKVAREKLASFNEGVFPKKRAKKNLVQGQQKLASLCSHYANGQLTRDAFLASVARSIRIGDW